MTAYINPSIIRWARERNGLTIEELAYQMKKNPDEIQSWESGEGSPSYPLLELLAYKHLKIPLAVFFFPEPPDIEDALGKFRRLPSFEMERLSADTLQIIRSSLGYQDSLEEILGSSEARRRIFVDIDIRNMEPIDMANVTRAYLGISIEQQFQFTGLEDAFKAWRTVVEDAGIFTFKNTFKDRFISGFSLLHEHFPIIVVNNSNSFSRQIFTVAHELGHILSGVYGVTDIDEQYIRYLDSEQRELEINCNKFAAELLVPRQVFENDIPAHFSQNVVEELANKYSVSREVILRRFLEYGVVSEDYYVTKADEWNKDYLRSGKSKGGDWYRTQLSYLGEGYSALAFANYYSGRFSKEQLAEHLNMNAKNIDKYEFYIAR